jgi:hypothetical protein
LVFHPLLLYKSVRLKLRSLLEAKPNIRGLSISNCANAQQPFNQWFCRTLRRIVLECAAIMQMHNLCPDMELFGRIAVISNQLFASIFFCCTYENESPDPAPLSSAQQFGRCGEFASSGGFAL